MNNNNHNNIFLYKNDLMIQCYKNNEQFCMHKTTAFFFFFFKYKWLFYNASKNGSQICEVLMLQKKILCHMNRSKGARGADVKLKYN
jgi:hypothetical protein